MEIRKEQKDELQTTIVVNVGKDDYEAQVDKSVEDTRKKLNMKGFRPGKVPVGVVKKMYYKSILVEEINKIMHRSLFEYIEKEKIDIIGEPMLNEETLKNINWDNNENFEFSFDIALKPEINYFPSKSDEIIKYKIKIDDSLREKYTESYRYRMGYLKDMDEANDTCMVKADIDELQDDGSIKQGGISVKDVPVSMRVIKDEEIKKNISGKKKDDTIVVDINKLFPTSAELSSALKLKKNEAEKLSGRVIIKITEIKDFTKAEINQDFYDKVFGENNVKSEEEFKTKLDEEISKNLEIDITRKLNNDIADYLLETINPSFAHDLLKRWLIGINKDKVTPEQLEKEYPDFEKSLKWELIKNNLVKAQNIDAAEEEIKDFIKVAAKQQYYSYGYTNIPDEQFDYIVGSTMKNEEEVRKVKNTIVEGKMFDFIRNEISLKEKEVSMDEFNALNEKK